ncbi:MAG: cupin domain-containing protein [Halobaculum sp.]
MTDETDRDGTEIGDVVDVGSAFDAFDEQWSPRVAARLNGQAVKFARLEGEFVWHAHPEADELFWVIEGGPLRIAFRDREPAVLDAGQLLVVPAGVEHKPVAESAAKVALFEPAGTENTGDAESDRTREAVSLDE